MLIEFIEALLFKGGFFSNPTPPAPYGEPKAANMSCIDDDEATKNVADILIL